MLAVSSGRRQIPAGPPPASSNSLDTIPAPLFRSCSSVNSRIGVRIGSYPARRTRRASAARAPPAGRSRPAASRGCRAPVRPAAPRRCSHAGARGSAAAITHEPAPSCLMICSALLHRVFQHRPGEPLVLLAGGEVAEVEDLPGLLRRARRSRRACARASSRNPSACRSGSGRGTPRRRCPRPAAAPPSRKRSTGSVPGKVRHQHRRGRRRLREPAGLVHQGQQPVQPDRGARRPAAAAVVNRLARLS